MSNSINKNLRNPFNIIHSIINNYVEFMQTIGYSMENNDENIEINKRKLLDTRKEVYNFIVKHKNIFELSEFTIKTENFEWRPVVAIDSFENFFNLDDFLKYISEKTEIHKTYPNTVFDMNANISFDYEEIQSIKSILGLRECKKLHSEDIRKFFDNNFLVDKEELKTKCTNYKELLAYIKKRRNDYLQSKVSAERINELSFTFNDSIEGFEDEKSCGVCLKDYEEGQEVCRLPCNHFCCKNCTGDWFAVPDKFQCPICRDDCS